MSWTRARVQRLRELAALGRSFLDAARDLGVTRGAIAGKAHREGIAFQGAPLLRPMTSRRARNGWARLSPAARAARIAATLGKANLALAAQRAAAR